MRAKQARCASRKAFGVNKSPQIKVKWTPFVCFTGFSARKKNHKKWVYFCIILFCEKGKENSKKEWLFALLSSLANEKTEI